MPDKDMRFVSSVQFEMGGINMARSEVFRYFSPRSLANSFNNFSSFLLKSVGTSIIV